MGKWRAVGSMNGTDVAAADRFLASDESQSVGSRDKTLTRSALSLAVPKYAVLESSHGLSVGDAVRFDGSNWVEATADTAANARLAGIVTEVADTDNFVFQNTGFTDALSGFTAGDVLYLQDAGGLGTSKGSIVVPVGVASDTTDVWFLPLQTVGNLGDAEDFDTTGVATSSIIVRNASGSWQILKNNVTTSDPTSSDDSGSGYDYGSRWINAVSAHEFVCVDPTASSAVWKQTT